MATEKIHSAFDIDTQGVLNILYKFIRRYEVGLWGKEPAARAWKDFKIEPVPNGRIFIRATEPHREGELGILRDTRIVTLEVSPRQVEVTLNSSTRGERDASVRNSNLAPDLQSQLLNPDTFTQIATAHWDSLETFYSRLVDYLRAELGEVMQAAANGAADRQAEAKPRNESKVKRIFGLRAEYLIAAIILGIIISVVSLFVFPDWAHSNLTLVILFPFGFAAATTFIANLRKAFE